jgi:PAS domain S-box-containing protein
LYFVGHFALGFTSSQNGLFIPDIAMWLAGASSIFSLVVIIVRRKEPSYWLGFAAYIATGFTIGVLIALTGGVNSPFIALWLMVGVLSGMFGSWAWFLILAGANAHVVYQFIFPSQPLDADTIVRLLLVAEAPLIASFVIWHKESNGPGGSDKAYNALAAQLSQVASKSEIVINSIADGVVALNAQGQIELINPAAQSLLGWSKQDAMGLDSKSVIKLVNSNGQEVAEELSPIKQGMLSNKSATNDTLSLLTKSGKKVLVSVSVTPVSEQSRSNGVILVFRDITREREQERQRAEFISTASHEMRTPVAAMEGYLGLAMNPQTATIDDKARNYLQKAYESTQHLGRLFQDLLTVSKAEDSRLMTRPAIIDVTAFTREIVDGLSQKAKDNSIGLVFAPGGVGDGTRRVQPSFYIHADPNQMREVLNNLVDNAIKYTKQGTVTVDIKGDEANVSVDITDTGIGIPPEDIAHLFQKFYRVDNSDTREIGGTGLGLYICRRLVEANNGHIGLTSTYGKGSTFSVKMPRVPNDQAANISNQEAAQQAAATAQQVGTSAVPTGLPTGAPAPIAPGVQPNVTP